jgi:ABC-type transporter Mla maintaining outer membrane lipid asymmetry ATPase subunit MlaF
MESNHPKSTSAPGEPVIEMRDISLGTQRDPQADGVSGVSWTVRAGEFWVVAGMHNSGKSDFLTAAAGLMRAKSGQFRLLGHDVSGTDAMPMDIRLRVGLVFDGGRIIHDLTLIENITLPLRYHEHLDEDAIAARVEEALRLTGLSEWADSPPAALGRNIQKRGGLARALVLHPEILLVDNPVDGLDPRETTWWLGMLRQVAAGHPFLGGRPLTLVVASTDLRPWKRLGARFALLNDGRFTVVGDDSQISGNTDILVKELLAEKSDGS